MFGPTVDPRAEPVPEIDSIEKVSKPIRRKGIITNPKIRKKTKRKRQKIKLPWIAAQRDRHTDSGMIGY
jgi:hypothetical protein